MNSDIKYPLFNNANIIKGNIQELKFYDDKDLELGEIKNIFENNEQKVSTKGDLFENGNAPTSKGFDAAF